MRLRKIFKCALLSCGLLSLLACGTGATVGKICGMRQSMKAGIGYYAVQASKMNDEEYLRYCL